MSRSEAYGYAVARIRAMEHRLFDAGLFGRLLEADDLNGALKILSETSYAKGLANVEESSRYDSALEAELLSSYIEIQTFVPDRSLTDLCRMPYDFHNVKVLLKSIFNARAGGRKRWDLLTPLGTVPVDDMVTQVESEDYVLLPFGLPPVISTCVTHWEQTGDVVEVERLLDEQMFRTVLHMAEDFGEQDITAWGKARIDAENLRNLLRLKRFGFDATRAGEFLHKGGTVSPEVLITLFAEPFDGWGRMIPFSNVGRAISAMQDENDFDAQIVSLEKTLDDYCQAVLSKARYSTSAPGNILAYLWGKEMEIKNIRTILVSKGMTTGREEVRGALRHGY